MSVVCYFRPGTKAKIMAGEWVHWVFGHKSRAHYLYACVMSYPPWVDKVDLLMLKAWADAMSAFHGERYVLDHIVPVTHDRVSGLGVPWNFQVIHWRVNGAKGNKWEPDQMELFA
jgi:hypothetical protein